MGGVVTSADDGSGSRAGAREAVELRPVLIGAGILLAVVLAVFWHFFATQFRYATRQQADWGHTLVIPLIAGYFVYLNRERLKNIGFRTTWIGLVPVIVGTAWYYFCWVGPPTVSHHNLRGSGFSLALFGIVLLFTGFRAMAILWFPLAYLCLFGQTISERLMNIVTFALQDITARGSHICLSLVGLDIERTGNILVVFDQGQEKPLNIAEACSGMRMLMAFLALGVAMAYAGFKRNWQRVVLVALGIPVAILVNILRVATLAVLSLYDVNFAAGDFHTFIGLLWLVPAFLLYLGAMWVIRQFVIEGEPPEGETA
jgi:exosortase